MDREPIPIVKVHMRGTDASLTGTHYGKDIALFEFEDYSLGSCWRGKFHIDLNKAEKGRESHWLNSPNLFQIYDVAVTQYKELMTI